MTMVLYYLFIIIVLVLTMLFGWYMWGQETDEIYTDFIEREKIRVGKI